MLIICCILQVIVAGKLRAQRAKAMKFRDGYMIKSGRVREGKSLYFWIETNACFDALPHRVPFHMKCCELF